MDSLLNELLIMNKLDATAALITISLALLSAAQIFVRLLRFFLFSLRQRHPRSGIYVGFWIDEFRGRAKCELVRLRPTVAGFKFEPLLRHFPIDPWRLIAARSGGDRHLFNCVWTKSDNSKYEGSAIFHYSQNKSQLMGRWIGPSSSGEVRGGVWFMWSNSPLDMRRKLRLLSSISPTMIRVSNIIERAVAARTSILTEIIQDHEHQQAVELEIRGTFLNILPRTFNPQRGAIAIPTLIELEKIAKRNMRVLDLGTGSGLFAIHLAKHFQCECVGVDTDHAALQLARSNAATNGVQEKIRFVQNEPGNLYSWARWNEEFDLIVANLPFSSIRTTFAARKSPYYRVFGGHRQTLVQLVLDTLYHLKPNGKVLISFGDSGYTRLFNFLLDVSPWQCQQLIDHRGPYDHTKVLMLEFSNEYRRHFDEIAKPALARSPFAQEQLPSDADLLVRPRDLEVAELAPSANLASSK